MKPSWTHSAVESWDEWFFGGGLQREGVCQALLLLGPSKNRSGNETGNVFTERAAEAGVGVVSKQNETLGKNATLNGGRNKRKAKLQFASHGRSGPQSLHRLLLGILRYAPCS